MIGLTFLSLVALASTPPEWTGKELGENSQLLLTVSLDTKTPYSISMEKVSRDKMVDYFVKFSQKNKKKQHQQIKESEFVDLYEKFRLFAVEAARVIPLAPKTCQYPMQISLHAKKQKIREESICTDFFGATENKKYQEWIESVTLGLTISKGK